MSVSSGSAEPFAMAMGPVARELLGEPNGELSSTTELRFGTRGSLAVRLDSGTYFDNETGDGGGVLKFVQVRQHTDKAGALKWLTEKGHLPKTAAPKTAGKRIVATYDYLDADGGMLFQVVRYDPKDFRQRAPNGNGGWVYKTAGVQRVPYRLPALIKALAAGQTIFISEGEKGVLSLEALGLVGTNSPGGAGKWRPQFNKLFAGADVVVLSDNDPQKVSNDGTLEFHPSGKAKLPGQDHAADVANNLHGIAKRVRVLMLPDLPLKGDVADWVAAGGTREALEALAAAAPDWTPTPEEEQPANHGFRVDSGRNEPELTEDGLALAFAREHEQHLRYCHDTAAWFLWDGVTWRRERTKLAFAWARERALVHEYTKGCNLDG